MLAPEVLARVADLELVARRTVEGLRSGQHRSPFHGYSAEFSQYRHYRAGDDLKHVDWKLVARTGRLYTKQFRETTDLAAQIVIDASRSMRWGAPGALTKFDYAVRIAATLAWLLAEQGDAVGMLALEDARRVYVPARAGRSHLRLLLQALAKLAPAGSAPMATPVRLAAEALGRRGLLIVLSDLYDEEEAVATEIRRAVRRGHEVVVLQVMAREELDLAAGGTLELEDLETGARHAIEADEVRAAYRQNVAAFLARWRARALAEGLDYALLVTDVELDHAVRELLLKRR